LSSFCPQVYPASRLKNVVSIFLLSTLFNAPFGCENWALNRVDRRKIETAEIKFLRRVAGYTLRDEVRNTIIRKELQIFNIGERVQSRKIKWHEHLSRMEQQGIAQQIMFYRPIGYRDIGRPRRRWEDTF
jgi:hypothetical protein